MPSQSTSFQTLRVLDLSSGFTVDPDWVATDDVLGWAADSKPQWWKPSHNLSQNSGRIELLLAFYDTPSVPIPGLLNTRIDIDLVERIRIDENAIPPRLFRRGAQKPLSGNTVYEDPLPIVFQAELGVRFISSQSLPTANFLTVLGRIF